MDEARKAFLSDENLTAKAYQEREIAKLIAQCSTHVEFVKKASGLANRDTLQLIHDECRKKSCPKVRCPFTDAGFCHSKSKAHFE